jgi:hypothetical protein
MNTTIRRAVGWAALLALPLALCVPPSAARQKPRDLTEDSHRGIIDDWPSRTMPEMHGGDACQHESDTTVPSCPPVAQDEAE